MKFVLNISTLSAADGGPPRAVLQNAMALRKRGHSVTVVALSAPSVPELSLVDDARQVGVRVRLVPVRRLGAFRFSLKQLVVSVRESRDAQIVSIHGYYQFTAIVGLITSLVRGCELWLQPHGVFESYQETKSQRKKTLYWALAGRMIRRRVTRVVAASESERSGIEHHRFPGRIVDVQPLGVNTLDIRLSREASVSPFTVLFMSRIAQKKRLDLLLEAITSLRSRSVDVRLLVCGSGEPEFERDLRSRYLGPGVEWRGQVEGPAQQAAYASSDIFVLPSENENFGQAVTDAMAVGLPVIVSEEVAASTHVRQAEAGVVIVGLTIDKLTESIERLLLDAEGRRVMSINGLEYARKHLTWDAFAEAWELSAEGSKVPESRAKWDTSRSLLRARLLSRDRSS